MKTYELKLIKTPLWNPLTVYIDNKGYVLDNIVFYHKDGTIIDVGCGWFGTNSFDVLIATSKPLKRKIKVDFSKKETFIIKSSCTYENRYILYIPIEDILIRTNYTKDNTGIRVNYKFIDMNNHECTWYKYVKTFLSMKYNIIEEFNNEIQKLDKFSYTNIPQKEFDMIINNLKRLYNEYQKTLQHIENYTVEDYFKEVIQ